MDNENLTNEALEVEAEAPANETKSEKFTRLAVPRINKVLNGLDSLGKLSNRSSYEYSDEQVEKMFAAIRTHLDDAEAKFKPKETKAGTGFTF